MGSVTKLGGNRDGGGCRRRDDGGRTAGTRTAKATLYEGPIRNPLIGTFNGLDPAGRETFAGDYRIRWTFRGGYREYPIRIVD